MVMLVHVYVYRRRAKAGGGGVEGEGEGVSGDTVWGKKWAFPRKSTLCQGLLRGGKRQRAGRLCCGTLGEGWGCVCFGKGVLLWSEGGVRGCCVGEVGSCARGLCSSGHDCGVCFGGDGLHQLQRLRPVWLHHPPAR